MIVKTLTDLDNVAKAGLGRLRGDSPQIIFGLATCGIASGGKALRDYAERYLAKKGFKADILSVGCIGMCHAEPLVDVKLPGKPRVTYSEVDEEKLKRIIDGHLMGGEPVNELALAQLSTDLSVSEVGALNYSAAYEGVPRYEELPFFSKQLRIVLRNCGVVEPVRVDEYIARGGYRSAYKVLHEMAPEEVIETVKRSGLKGRGGAGFLTGLKWEFCRKAPGREKYMICNADEGDPGAYMDRAVLEGDPHSVIEGMIISAYAIGATQGFIYVRTEYPLAIEHVQHALRQAREMGLLGENILGTNFSYDIGIREGAGVFVCGEETALIRSIEGKRGEPRQRPPFPATKGLWDKPTNINNVETLASVPMIIQKGGDWYASLGTKDSKGTKVFSLVGKINKPGLIEVPMGIRMRDIIYYIGGGIPDRRKFKAVQTGGPSGGCIPLQHLDVAIDYETLKSLGSIMGSGGMVVMDEDTCMVDVARYFLGFTSEESCGQCTPCRVGTKRLLEVLNRITSGKGVPADAELLKDMAEMVRDSSLCALGGTAPNPILTTLRYFMNEYEEHIHDKKCDASVCAALFKAPCQNTCPAGTNVPGYIQLIKDGKYSDAYELNREDNPFPSICGRVCEHPCESRCRRSQFDSPISIRELKRFCSDTARLGRKAKKPPTTRLKKTGKTVAIVGGGPAGLSAAFFLARLGHSPTIYESSGKLGGMLRWGIPKYRLPHEIIDMEVNDILELGVDVKYNVSVGNDVKLKELADKFDAVFIAVGAQGDRRLGLESDDKPGIVPGLNLLREINAGKVAKLGKRLIVIGGGNVAVDVARSTLRLGCEKVSICYRREEQEMPAYLGEIEAAKAEGIEFHFLVAPEKIIVEGDKAVGVLFRKNTMGDYDNWGRRQPVPTDETLEIRADTIVPAIGQDVDGAFADGFADKLIGKKALVCADGDSLATPVERIFAGGDAVTGPASAIEAIAQGKGAARSIGIALTGEDRFLELQKLNKIVYSMTPPTDNEKVMERERPKHAPAKKRACSFEEVVQCMDEDGSRREAARCFRCDLSAEEEGER
ncbi:MAG: NADH-quinone oxidoreductase subunit NuoF [Euryarchaeota archaeon]|nr:NADH-quinone oxidoreductase subunit NuoF [Euryarchaeota archaeon]